MALCRDVGCDGISVPHSSMGSRILEIHPPRQREPCYSLKSRVLDKDLVDNLVDRSVAQGLDDRTGRQQSTGNLDILRIDREAL